MLRITTLSENTASQADILAEWGLSVLVETDQTAILLDTGRGVSTAHNADMLGVDLARVSRIVLSHGHKDHTGGLRSVLGKMRKQVEVVAHPAIWEAKYSKRDDGQYRYAGIPFQRHELESLGATFNLTGKPVKLSADVMTTGEVPMVTPYESVGPRMCLKTAGGWQPDEMPDDQALVVTTGVGLVVILGCAHRGMINTLLHAQQLTGVKEIHAVLGGSHLIGASEERLLLTIDALRELGVARLGLCHCTSLPAISILAHEFGEQFFFNVAGTRITVPEERA